MSAVRLPFTRLVLLSILDFFLLRPLWQHQHRLWHHTRPWWLFQHPAQVAAVDGRYEAIDAWPTLEDGEAQRGRLLDAKRCNGPSGIALPGLTVHPLSKKHTIPTLGTTNLFPSDVCMTYKDRYRAYTDEALGVSTMSPAHPSSTVNLTEQVASLNWKEAMDQCGSKKTKAVVLRCYEGFPWSLDDVYNVRALIAELALDPDFSYTVHILVEVHSRDLAFQTSARARLAALQRSVPREFWSLVTLWSEDQMASLYPRLPLTQGLLNYMSAQSSYQSCFMPLQKFALDHEDYDFIWNWEMDVRSTFDYRTIIQAVEGYAQSEERSASACHWSLADQVAYSAGKQEADLITLNPMFDVKGSGWYWSYDVQNYPDEQETERRASIGTTVRFSRRMLQQMSLANADDKRSMQCTSFPASVALHSHCSDQEWARLYSAARPDPPLKAVYVRHPIYMGHRWDFQKLMLALSRPDFYLKANEKTMRDASFYYDGGHALAIYLGWMNNDRSVCRAPSLLHPIKSFNRPIALRRQVQGCRKTYRNLRCIFATSVNEAVV